MIITACNLEEREAQDAQEEIRIIWTVQFPFEQNRRCVGRRKKQKTKFHFLPVKTIIIW